MAKTEFIWDVVTDNVMMEKDGAGTTQAVYTQEPSQYGRLISQRRGSQTSYYHFDGNGNTRALTDASQTVTDRYTYTAFGDQVATTGTTINRYRFGGQHGYQYSQATDAYYVRARVYQPKRGRWMSKDPLRFVLDGGNRYRYTEGRPVGDADPSGFASENVVRNVHGMQHNTHYGWLSISDSLATGLHTLTSGSLAIRIALDADMKANLPMSITAMLNTPNSSLGQVPKSHVGVFVSIIDNKGRENCDSGRGVRVFASAYYTNDAAGLIIFKRNRTGKGPPIFRKWKPLKAIDLPLFTTGTWFLDEYAGQRTNEVGPRKGQGKRFIDYSGTSTAHGISRYMNQQISAVSKSQGLPMADLLARMYTFRYLAVAVLCVCNSDRTKLLSKTPLELFGYQTTTRISSTKSANVNFYPVGTAYYGWPSGKKPDFANLKYERRGGAWMDPPRLVKDCC